MRRVSQKKNKAIYKRILIKISGEILAGKQGFGLNSSVLQQTARELKEVSQCGVQVAIVIGGGNILRGVDAIKQGMERVSSDHMGMLATCINALALQNMLEQNQVKTRVLSAIEISDMAEPYIYRKALRHLEKNRVLIFSGGTGNPYFSTDTASALRAIEISADILLKATKVDGVFDKDPMLHKESSQYKSISYKEILNKDLKIMDGSAISLCREHQLPLIIFNLKKKGNLIKVVCGESIGTKVL